MEKHIVKYNCESCGVLETRLVCSDNTFCAACTINPAIFRGRGRTPRRTCLCRFCHTVFSRGKREPGVACGKCARYIDENGLTRRYDLAPAYIYTVHYSPFELWRTFFGGTCVICNKGQFDYGKHCLNRQRLVCDNTWIPCVDKYKRRQRQALLGCLKRLGVYKDLRQHIHKMAKQTNTLPPRQLSKFELRLLSMKVF